jgi:S-DNA-T family DNA segregation ATPase FtsK/SpoIIIE
LPTAIVSILTVLIAGAWTIGLTRTEVRYALGQLRKRLQEAIPEAPVEPVQPEPAPALSRPARSLQIITAAEPATKRPIKRDRRLPPLDLLDEPQDGGVSKEEVERKADIIEETLDEFGLPVKVVEVRHGPVVTQFGVEPGYLEKTGPDGEPWDRKVRVGQVSSLAQDLALALAAPSLRIEAPVPGRSVIGIEVPNDVVARVYLRSVMASKAFSKIKSPLAVALGQDVSGAPVAADLAKMPHLLIAGTTGSGKSVCISSMVTCLTFNNSPERLRLVMIDPKMVEMIRFNGLPHLLGNVEVELERIIGVLRWVTREMDRRYELLAEAGARHVDDYNQQMKASRQEILPYIVVLVDELADLMMMAASETEHTITRLAQMARAVGIHLVVATQRPSTDVVTGLIKANFPARISFAVASQTDSRVILDHVGAESLLGRGDMLFLNPESGLPLRLQACLTTDREIEALVDYWRQEIGHQEPEAAPWESMLREGPADDQGDPLLEEAIELVREAGEASASMLQRRMRIGFPRAAALIDDMEDLGVVGPPETGGRTREVFEEGEDEYGTATV